MSSDSIGVFGRVVRVRDSTDSDEAVRTLPPGPRFRTRLADFLCFLVPLAIEAQSHLSSERIDGMREELSTRSRHTETMCSSAAPTRSRPR